MSLVLQGMVFRLPLNTHPKFVLQAIADSVDEETCRGFVKVETLALFASQSERNVQKWLSMFEAWGLIRRKKRVLGGRMRANLFILNRDLLVRDALLEAIRRRDERDGTDDFKEAVYKKALAPKGPRKDEDDEDLRGDSDAPLDADGEENDAPGVTLEGESGVTPRVSPESPPYIESPVNSSLNPLPHEGSTEPTFADFCGRHPDVNAMGDEAAKAEWKALSAGQRRRAYEMAEPYAKSLGKQRTVRAAHWLKHRMFDDPKLKAVKVSAAPFVFVKRDSDEHRSWLVFRFVLTGARRIFTSYRPAEGSEGWDAPSAWSPLRVTLDLPPEGASAATDWFFLKRGTPNWAAWQTWLEKAPKPPGSVWARTHSPIERDGWWFPHPWPPRADGTFSPLTPEEASAETVRQADDEFLDNGGQL